MVERHRKGSSAPLLVREMHVRTAVECCPTPDTVAVTGSLQISAEEHVERREPSDTVGENACWCTHRGKQYGASLERFLK